MADLNIQLTRTKTGLFDLTVTEADGVTPQELHGAVLYFHAGNGSFSIEKNSPDGGIDITDEVAGTATLTIDPEDTEALSIHGTYSMPCELTMVVGSAAYPVAKGSLSVTPNVGEP